MFIAFDFGNFRSFRDLQRLSLEAMPLRTNDSGLEEGNVFQTSSIRLLKTKAVFGGNSSGKSNLAKAFAAFCLMVARSVVQEGLPKQIWQDRFQLITEWDEQPVFFQYVFLAHEIVYRYGFQILNGKISYEWLYGVKDGKEEEYYMRSPEELKFHPTHFPNLKVVIDQALKSENELYRDDSLFLTATALTGNKLLAKLRDVIRRVIAVDGVYDDSAIDFAMKTLHSGSDEQKQAIKDLLHSADTGVENLDVAELPEHISDKILKDNGDPSDKKLLGLFSFHSVFDENGEVKDTLMVPFIEWESQGTSKLLGIGALILSSLKEGRTIIIDEFDARFHPNLTLKIVQLYHDKKTNPLNAQLIFITHDTGLMRRAELRRDQICLVNKNRFGISSITTLIEFKGVRKDASYEKEYLNGSYAAVPFLEQLNWALNKKTTADEL